jgi:hypothetical protein
VELLFLIQHLENYSYDNKIEEIPILYCDKLGLFVFGGCMRMWKFPILLFSDIFKNDKMKNRDINYL